MVDFIEPPTQQSEKEAVGAWSRTRGIVKDRYDEIWSGIRKIPEGDNGES